MPKILVDAGVPLVSKLKLISWNVNSLRAREPLVQKLIEQEKETTLHVNTTSKTHTKQRSSKQTNKQVNKNFPPPKGHTWKEDLQDRLLLRYVLEFGGIYM